MDNPEVKASERVATALLGSFLALARELCDATKEKERSKMEKISVSMAVDEVDLSLAAAIVDASKLPVDQVYAAAFRLGMNVLISAMFAVRRHGPGSHDEIVTAMRSVSGVLPGPCHDEGAFDQIHTHRG